MYICIYGTSFYLPMQMYVYVCISVNMHEIQQLINIYNMVYVVLYATSSISLLCSDYVYQLDLNV